MECLSKHGECSWEGEGGERVAIASLTYDASKEAKIPETNALQQTLREGLRKHRLCAGLQPQRVRLRRSGLGSLS